MNFMPIPRPAPIRCPGWYMSEGCVERMLAVLGFTLERKTRAQHRCTVRLTGGRSATFVARRSA